MKRVCFVVMMCFVVGCNRVPDDLMRPSGATLQVRETQSRTFDSNSDKKLMRASIAVLQDMGYVVKESSAEYGVVTATKEASAVSAGQVVASIALAALTGVVTPIDQTQYISVTMVVLDRPFDQKVSARTTFQRVVERTDKTQYAQTITDKDVYCDFYNKLDKALFLEGSYL